MLIGVLENQLADRLYEKHTFTCLSAWSQFYLIRGFTYLLHVRAGFTSEALLISYWLHTVKYHYKHWSGCKCHATLIAGK